MFQEHPLCLHCKCQWYCTSIFLTIKISFLFLISHFTLCSISLTLLQKLKPVILQSLLWNMRPLRKPRLFKYSHCEKRLVLLGVFLAKVEELVFIVIVQLTFFLDDISLFLHVQSSLLVLVFIFVFQLTEEFLAWMTVKSSSCLLVDLTNGCSKQYYTIKPASPLPRTP